ncbi:M23 family metallopeptidase [Alcaligenes ammonioxydans]|uniref:M23 family metallopeptidase n=1 Tax=Alcaligenes ammonioxydans TaxID=2582914 RepID=A0ABX8SQ95_9BURK|nr:M23 family metallopeptidase [Alcaligenes ammonioxydans]EJC61664.1 metallopeptidase [Alcaligenes faecalis subsp. faecalis NCIB 8687]QBH20176.1 M23 family metallopeptidase [Alcaligenes faecalis]MCH1879377.1 M23 family metallopeptidase [Alcaligenes ammonioxydans]QXX78212.1 M23 family metallopeptidase [Alcaligenes ammonioxydans]WGQ36352.1 M23 family metallopeptidase [Alcaligenes faecalis]
MDQHKDYTSLDVKAKGVRRTVIAVVALVSLGVSAAAGALVQSHWSERNGVSLDTEMAQSQAAAMQDNVTRLAEKVGGLQAKLIEMDGVSKRVAKAAGIEYTDPELAGSMPVQDLAVMDSMDGADLVWNADRLGEQLDNLAKQMSEQQDWFQMLDSVLTERTGNEARLPNYRPVDYDEVASSFGWRRHPISGRHALHEGLDFPAPKGTPIYAASGGVVSEARYMTGYGKLVEINHGNGMSTRYAHASSIVVKLGDVVEKGQLIARVGSTGQSTGSHLHFEVRMAGHALDPKLFLPAREYVEQQIAQLDSDK